MPPAVSRIVQSYKDHGSAQHPYGEPANIGLYVRDLTAANLTAQQALHTALFNTLANCTLGMVVKQMTVISDTVIASGPATSPLAQRENKWLIRYHDATTGEKLTAQLPDADLTLLGANSEFMDPTGAEFIALKAAFEAVVYAPDTGNLVILDSLQFVGRNL